MAAGYLTPYSFDDVQINDGTIYAAKFVAERGGLDAVSFHPSQAMEADVPGSFPVPVRPQPMSRDLQLEVILKTNTQANIEALKQLFGPMNGLAYLVATDDAGVYRRILCQPVAMTPPAVPLQDWHITVHASTGIWEALSETYASNTIAATATTIALTNPGNAEAALRIAMTPTSAMGHANGLIRRVRIPMAWRSELPATDPVGDGYPIDLGQDAFDTLTLSGAGKMQADEDDLRVYLDGSELYRWLDPAGATNATTKVWVNARFAPMRKVTLTAAMASSSVPAAGSTFTVNNPEGTAGWPMDAFLIVGTECIHVAVYDSVTFLVVQRGALGTTAAAHSASDPAYYVEHPYLSIMYDWTAATAPNAPTDRQPLIDLATSTNLVWHWTGNFLVPSGTRRSGGWLPEYTDEGGAANIRQYETGGTFVFEDTLPAAGKPLFNNLSRDFPVPISAAANSVEFDMTVNNNFLLNAYLLDLYGYESRLVNQGPTAALTNQQFTPATVAQKLRFNGRIGCVIGYNTTVASLNADALSNGTNNRDGFRIVLDQTTTIHSLVVALSETSASTDNVQCLIMTDVTDAPSNTVFMANSSVIPTIPNAGIGTMAAFLVTLSTPVTLPAGTYWVTLSRSAATGTVNFGRTLARVHARMYGRIGGTTDPQSVPYGRVLSKTTEPQSDAALQTGEQIILDNIDITLDNTTPRTPLIVMGAEESMYLMQSRIRSVRNWLTNSGFESNTTGHAATGTSTIARSVVRSHSGIASLLCTYQNSTTLDEYAITLAAANQNYTLSAWVWIPSNWDGGAIQLSIASFTSSATVTSAFADMTRTNQWQRIRLTFSVASDVAGLLRVIAASAPTAGRFIYVDDMQLEPGSNLDAGGYFDTDGDFGGDYLDVYFPSALNKALLIDCGQRLVWDTELNQPVPFAVNPSNPQKMLGVVPGTLATHLYYTEVGATGLSFETSFRAAYL